MPPENFEEGETDQRDVKLGHGDLMGMPLLSPMHSRNEGNEHFEDDRASQVSSIIPAALVRPVLADGSTYDGDGSSNNNNNLMSPSPSKNGSNAGIMSEGRGSKQSPVGQRASRSMVVQNLRRRNASFGGAVEKRKLEDKKQMMFMKDTEEAKNHLGKRILWAVIMKREGLNLFGCSVQRCCRMSEAEVIDANFVAIPGIPMRPS